MIIVETEHAINLLQERDTEKDVKQHVKSNKYKITNINNQYTLKKKNKNWIIKWQPNHQICNNYKLNYIIEIKDWLSKNHCTLLHANMSERYLWETINFIKT